MEESKVYNGIIIALPFVNTPGQIISNKRNIFFHAKDILGTFPAPNQLLSPSKIYRHCHVEFTLNIENDDLWARNILCTQKNYVSREGVIINYVEYPCDKFRKV